MAKLFIRPDGASPQAAAVLAYLREGDGIEESWSADLKDYQADPQVDRWHNGREQGYVVSMRAKNYGKQINIAFFEHRNLDSICAIVFEVFTMNPPTLADIPEGVYKTKWDTAKDFGYGEAAQMATWIKEQLVSFWKANDSSVSA